MSYDGPTDLYIDGEWTKSAGGDTITTIDPATEGAYATVECADADSVDSAVSAAKAAFEERNEWRGRGHYTP